MSNEKDKIEGVNVDTAVISRTDSDNQDVVDNGETAQTEPKRPMASKRALIAWLVLCFSVSMRMAEVQHRG